MFSGLPCTGPSCGSRGSITMPAISAVRSRISAMIWAAGRRWRQSSKLRLIEPIWSGEAPLLPAPDVT